MLKTVCLRWIVLREEREGKVVGNFVLTTDCFKGMGYSLGREGIGELFVDRRLC